MSEQDEIEFGQEILRIDADVVKCFLCHQTITPGDKSFLLFNERVQDDGTFDCPLSQILASALALDVDESNYSSLCSDCNEMALDFEQTERQLFELRNRIINTYEASRKCMTHLANETENQTNCANDESSVLEFVENASVEILGSAEENSIQLLDDEGDADATDDDAVQIADEEVLVYKVSFDSYESDTQNAVELQDQEICEKISDASILNESSKKNDATPMQNQKRTQTKPRPFVCEKCQKTFVTQYNLDAHGITHSGVRPYSCKTCGKAFARKAEMIDHERIHSGLRPFKCEFCEASFTQRSNLSAHKKTTHFQEKLHQCDLCERSFKRRRLLEYHVNAAHTGIRPYKCDTCDSSFVYREHYKKHLIIHTGEKPYACEVCNKRFNSRDNRNAHRFVHSDKKPYECVQCGTGFMRKPLLLAHMKNARHSSDTIIVNQPQINGGVLETTTVKMPSAGSTATVAEDTQEYFFDTLDEENEDTQYFALKSEDCELTDEHCEEM